MDLGRSYRLVFLAGAVIAQALLPADALAQIGDLRLRHLTRIDGLPHDVVTALHRDSTGFLWIGTEDGLVRFDGQDTLSFRSKPADPGTLSDSWITVLHEPDARTLLVGTRHGGLNRINLESNQVARIGRPGADSTGTDEAVVDMAGTANGTTVVAYGRGGLWRLGGAGEDLQRIEVVDSPLDDLTLFQVAEDRSGRLWVGTWRSGLFALVPASGDGLSYRVDSDLAPAIPEGRIRALIAEPDGSILVGTSGAGLFRWDPATGTLARWSRESGLSDNRVYAVARDPRGILWLGTFGGGLNRLEPGSGRVSVFGHDESDPYSPSHDAINAVYLDQGGALWLGTDAGVDFASLVVDGFEATDVVPGGRLLAVGNCPSAQGCLHVATAAGIHRLSYREGAGFAWSDAAATADSPSASVSAMVGGDTLLVATRDRGLFRVTPGSTSAVDLQLPAGGARVSIQDLAVDSRGRTWVATDGSGVLVLGRSLDVIAHWDDSAAAPGFRNVSRLHAAGQRVWIGTFDGRVFVGASPDEAPTEVFPLGAGNSAGRVVGFAEADGSGIWIAYRDRLIELDGAFGVAGTIGRGEGLPSEAIVTVARAPDSSLWVATHEHLVGIRGGTPDIVLPLGFRQFGLETVLDLRGTPGGEVVLATDRRLYAFQPDHVRHGAWTPALVLTAVTSGTQDVASNVRTGDPVTLLTAADAFSFSVAFPEFSAGGTTEISYRLEGFDTGWHRASGSHVTLRYSNGDRRGGDFPLYVEARTSDGRSVRLQVPVHIPLPWWRSRWFLGIVVLGLATAVTGSLLGAAHRHRRRLRETRMLIEASRERQREMVARLIHDEPLQELYTIRMRLQLAADGRASPDADLASAREAAERATDRLREICRELRPAVLAGSDLAQAIRGHADGVNGLRHDVDITVELDATGQQCDDVRTALFGVYLNALNNALRHSGAGSIRISLHRDGGRLLLEVVDDGSGFEASHDWLALAREGHFGFLDMSEWMRMVGGDLRVESRPGAGCTITAVAPVAMNGDRGMRAWIRRATRQGDRT